MNSHSLEKLLGEIGSADRLLTALIALLLVSVVGFITGPVGSNANPFLWNLIGRVFGGVSRKTYNVGRSPASLAFRGAILASLMVLLAAILGAAAHMAIRTFPLNGFTEPVLLCLALTGGTVWLALNKLYHALAQNKKLTKGSYRPIAVSTRTDLNTTDDFGITRVGIGFAALSFERGVVAPLFWFLIGGIPLAYLYAGIAATRWLLAKDGFAKGTGNMALRLDHIFGCIPHLLSGLVMALAAVFTPTARITRAVPGLFSRKRAPYDEGGLTVTAVAWALNVSLGGPVQDVEGSVLKKAWVGPDGATARLDKGHLRRAIYMSVMAYVLIAALMIAGIVAHRFYSL